MMMMMIMMKFEMHVNANVNVYYAVIYIRFASMHYTNTTANQ